MFNEEKCFLFDTVKISQPRFGDIYPSLARDSYPSSSEPLTNIHDLILDTSLQGKDIVTCRLWTAL